MMAEAPGLLSCPDLESYIDICQQIYSGSYLDHQEASIYNFDPLEMSLLTASMSVSHRINYTM